MKLTIEEINKRINWTLEEKIYHSLEVIDTFINQYPNSIVAFSGGVDSTVLLYLARIVDRNKKGIFANTTNEFAEIIKFVKQTNNIEIFSPQISFQQFVQTNGFPLISKKIARMIYDLRHPTDNNKTSRNLYLTGIKKDGTKTKSFKLPEKYKHLIDVPFDITYKCCDLLKKQPMKKFSKQGVIIGTMAIDSSQRMGVYQKTGCINLKENKCMPLSIWTKNNIWEFIKRYNVSYCDIYNKGETSTGCAYCGFGCQFDKRRFDRLKIREPRRYKQMMNLENNGVKYKDAIQIAVSGIDKWKAKRDQYVIEYAD